MKDLIINFHEQSCLIQFIIIFLIIIIRFATQAIIVNTRTFIVYKLRALCDKYRIHFLRSEGRIEKWEVGKTSQY